MVRGHELCSPPLPAKQYHILFESFVINREQRGATKDWSLFGTARVLRKENSHDDAKQRILDDELSAR